MPKQITRVRWSATNLPYGVAFDENTGIFSGNPVNSGDFTIPVKVETNYGSDTKDITLNIEDSKGEWKEITGPDGIVLEDCVDNGREIIFFGRGQTDLKSGVFFTYNPNTNVYSDVYNLVDGEKYTGTTDATAYEYVFKACAHDPVSKKWLVLIGNNYVRTPTGVKNLGSDVDFYAVTLCWANNLQKFCVIGQSSGKGLTSYLFDVNGNLLDKSSAINLISGFTLYPSTNASRSTDNHICWSDTENKFVIIGDRSSVIAYSPDGLNWSKATLSGGLSYTSRIICRAESLGLFIAASSTSSSTNIFTSPDGLTWTAIKSIANFHGIKITWSESKKALCLVGTLKKSYITEDFMDWEQPVMSISVLSYGGLIWSDTTNAFIVPQGGTNKFAMLRI